MDDSLILPAGLLIGGLIAFGMITLDKILEEVKSIRRELQWFAAERESEKWGETDSTSASAPLVSASS